MSNAPKYLDSRANHFAHSDWEYTRHCHIKDVRYEKDYDKENKLSRRIKNSFKWTFNEPKFMKQLNEDRNVFQRLNTRIGMSIYSLKREPHIPDGVLDNGSIIAFWEETGEYLQLVQPSVGALLANFLQEEPEHPHAKLITAELERILARYGERIKNKEVD